MSFNVADMPEVKESWFRKFAFMSPVSPGKITRSGYPEGYMPVTEDLKVDWLVGGCSGWSREVIESHRHPIDFQTKWAVYEDAIFSYGASKSSKLFVACNAMVKHNEDYGNFRTEKPTSMEKVRLSCVTSLSLVLKTSQNPLFYGQPFVRRSPIWDMGL